MGKTHLTYKVAGEVTGAALCGNNKRGYKFGLVTVLPGDFRSTPAKLRCAHCVRLYLTERNRIRKVKGLPPVKAPFEGQVHSD